MNLLGNAKDAFITQASKNRQLCIVAREDEGRVIVCVEDNAGGIDDSIMDKIFEPYFTTKVHTGGTGIGLYMSSMIVRQSFGGSLSVESIIHENQKIGARFVLIIPKKNALLQELL